MRPAFLIASSLVLVVLGATLLLAPIDQGPVVMKDLGPGSWWEVAVPSSASLGGATVDVRLSWGTVVPPCAFSFGPGCVRPIITQSFLMVFDCGAGPCVAGDNYSFVGGSDLATGGHTGFAGTPGHHYEVWAWHDPNSTNNSLVPVRYALVTPILHGEFGAVLTVLGGFVGVVGAREWVRSRRSGKSWRSIL